jgi:hypothetical protein
VVTHAQFAVFRLTEVVVPNQLFAAIVARIGSLRPVLFVSSLFPSYFFAWPGGWASTASASAWKTVSSATQLACSCPLCFPNHCLPRSW